MTCEELKSSVVRWIGDEIECRPSLDDGLIAVLPVLKPNGDAIEVGLEPLGDQRWRLSDLGETRATLYLGGVDFHEEYVRAEEFRQVLSSHRISERDQELIVEASAGQLVDVMFDFVHAIQSVLALQLTILPKEPKRDFAVLVAKFLAEHHASFEVPAVPIEGKTGRWKFNFVLNQVRQETLVKAITVSSVAEALRSAERAVFEILDVKDTRPGSNAVAIIDDEGRRSDYWRPNAVRVFEGWSVPVYPFFGARPDLTELALRYAVS